jgi:adenylate cyclase
MGQAMERTEFSQGNKRQAKRHAIGRDWLTVGRLRSVSASILLIYVVLHLSNHAVALVSLRWADACLAVLRAFWHQPVVTAILLLALLVHVGVALFSLGRRRHWRLTPWQWAQLGLGLSILPLGMTHWVGTRGAAALFDVETNHFWVLWSMASDPWQNLRQWALVLTVWLHACIGVHVWWRIKPWYPRWVPTLYAVALLLPAMALAGAGVGLGRVLAVMEQPERLAAELATIRPPGAAEVADLYLLSDVLKGLALALLILTLVIRQVSAVLRRRRQGLRLSYEGGQTFLVPAGVSLLEASQWGGIPHASVCGGRGRCTTCRARVSGPDGPRLPQPQAQESRMLQRMGLPEDVRLACQLRPPPGSYHVVPLLPADAQPSDAYRGNHLAVGEERTLAVMFVDLRGFTALSEKQLPFDVVFLLNRYCRSLGQAVERQGGHIDKFIGDGMMALFGLDVPPEEAAAQALRAAREVGVALAELNRSLEGHLSQPLAIGMGLHLGPAIVGVIGHGSAMGLTAIGDTVNTASRLEAMTKGEGVELLVSQALMEQACRQQPSWRSLGVALSVAPRGRADTLDVRAVANLVALPLS